MATLLIALGSMVLFVVAYLTYGRWLAGTIFELSDDNPMPSEQLRDGVDFVPTRRAVVMGHHFTSIAGTGPIVGPALAVFWGWLPALLWVVLGSIFIGAVHDLGALVVSLRNRGQTIGEVAGRLITPRARTLFLVVLFFALTVVLAIFGLVIAVIFKVYPQSVLSVWTAMPLAIAVGLLLRQTGVNLWLLSGVSLLLLYGAVWVGVYHLPIALVEPGQGEAVAASLGEAASHPVVFEVANPTMAWTAILMVYCFAASVMPVWLLLQPRDFVNSQQLVVALVLLVGGLLVAGLTGRTALTETAPAIVPLADVPADAPPIFPFLFITIACGACSGFHCVVSSGTSSKQVARETDARPIAYGSMLMEGMLAVLVILACTAGLGMGRTVDGQTLTGAAAWQTSYGGAGASWGGFGLAAKVGAFVEGGANFLAAIGLPLELAVGMIAVLVACFAATTLDTTTRLQRYVVQELGGGFGIRPLANKYAATALAVVLGLAVAAIPAVDGGKMGSGGTLLWPLFGATNQLLAGLALLVTVFYLRRRSKPIWFLIAPAALMLGLPAWAMLYQVFGPGQWLLDADYAIAENARWGLVTFGLAIVGLQVWMLVEAIGIWRRSAGELETPLPPLKPASA